MRASKDEAQEHSELLARLDAMAPAETAALCFVDPVLFCRYFLPHLFSKPMPWAHRALLAILLKKTEFLAKYGELDKIVKNFVDDSGQSLFVLVPGAEGVSIALRLGKHTAILMPRGFSKTTIAGQAVPLYNICYQIVRFTFYVSESATHSRMQATNVRRELDDNPRIKRVFGVLKPKGSDEQKWAEHFFETTTGFAVGTQGRNGQVRGMNHRGQRPKMILVDDVEDPESVADEAQRKKAREWFYADVLPALPPLEPDASLTVLGTLLDRDALMAHLCEDEDFTTVRLGALDKDGEPLWPAYMTLAEYERKKVQYQRRGLLHLFYKEYDNVIRVAEDAKFQQSYFQYGAPPPLSQLTLSIYCDPAISKKRTADEAVIVVAGMAENGLLWRLDEWAQLGPTPREIVDQFFALRKKWGYPLYSGMESNAYQAALVYLLKEEMFRKRDYFEVIPITNQVKKEMRIEGVLQPRYAAGYIWHARSFPEYEMQLLDWPTPKRFDRADATAGAIALLDPQAAQAGDPVALMEDKYPPLEDMVGGEWRRIV